MYTLVFPVLIFMLLMATGRPISEHIVTCFFAITWSVSYLIAALIRCVRRLSLPYCWTRDGDTLVRLAQLLVQVGEYPDLPLSRLQTRTLTLARPSSLQGMFTMGTIAMFVSRAPVPSLLPAAPFESTAR